MDCRMLIEEFADLNNSPAAVYNRLSYSQTTKSGCKQVPYKFKLAKSSVGHQNSNVVSSQSIKRRIDINAKAVADSSVIKTDAILAREAIKNYNQFDRDHKFRMMMKVDFKVMRDKKPLILTEHNHHNIQQYHAPEVHKSEQDETVEINEPNPAVIEESQVTLPKDEVKRSPQPARKARNPKQNSGLKRLFSKEESKRSRSPIFDTSTPIPPPARNPSREIDMSKQTFRPQTNLNSTLSKIYSQYDPPKELSFRECIPTSKGQRNIFSKASNKRLAVKQNFEDFQSTPCTPKSKSVFDRSQLYQPNMQFIANKVLVKRPNDLSNLLFNPNKIDGNVSRKTSEKQTANLYIPGLVLGMGGLQMSEENFCQENISNDANDTNIQSTHQYRQFLNSSGAPQQLASPTTASSIKNSRARKFFSKASTPMSFNERVSIREMIKQKNNEIKMIYSPKRAQTSHGFSK